MNTNAPKCTDSAPLDDLSLAILEVEIARPWMSSREIAMHLGLDCDRRTIDARRRNDEYQQRLRIEREDAIQLIKQAESRALHRLIALIDDPVVALILAAIHSHFV